MRKLEQLLLFIATLQWPGRVADVMFIGFRRKLALSDPPTT